MDLTELEAQFPGFYRPSDEDFTLLWTEGYLILDASVLLAFYRYSEDTREELFRVLHHFKGRIFVPHQAAAEFQENRLTVIRQQVAVYKELKELVDSSLLKVTNRVDQLKRHPKLAANEIRELVDAFQQQLTTYIEKISAEHPNRDLSAQSLMHDPIRDRIADAVGQGVGLPYDGVRRLELEAEAEQRFAAERPPGYRDKAKGGSRQFGDLYIWMQTLDFAKESGFPIIVVTDDEKDDWWWEFEGQKLGPRVELVAEMRTVTSQPMFMYTSGALLKAAGRYLTIEVSSKAIIEAQEVAEDLRTGSSFESVECPFCKWKSVVVKLGHAEGSSAIARCPSCAHRFHAHRTQFGLVRITRGSLGQQLQISCPECATEIRVDAPIDPVSERVSSCLNCFAFFKVDKSGNTESMGLAQVVNTEKVGNRRLACRRCGSDHPTFARHRGWIYAACYNYEPYLLLRCAALEVPDTAQIE